VKKGKRRRLKAWRQRRDVKRNEAILAGEWPQEKVRWVRWAGGVKIVTYSKEKA